MASFDNAIDIEGCLDSLLLLGDLIFGDLTVGDLTVGDLMVDDLASGITLRFARFKLGSTYADYDVGRNCLVLGLITVGCGLQFSIPLFAALD